MQIWVLFYFNNIYFLNLEKSTMLLQEKKMLLFRFIYGFLIT